MSGVTYSFEAVSAQIAGPTGGPFEIGYGASVHEEGITIDPAGDKSHMDIGSDGEGMHSLHADKSGHITVRLLQVSPMNAILQAQYDAQQLSPTLWGNNVIVVRNAQSGDITTARQCAFKKKPGLPYKVNGAFLEWAFDCIKIDTILGTY